MLIIIKRNFRQHSNAAVERYYLNDCGVCVCPILTSGFHRLIGHVGESKRARAKNGIGDGTARKRLAKTTTAGYAKTDRPGAPDRATPAPAILYRRFMLGNASAGVAGPVRCV